MAWTTAAISSALRFSDQQEENRLFEAKGTQAHAKESCTTSVGSIWYLMIVRKGGKRAEVDTPEVTARSDAMAQRR
jgi:hypothetical protein